MRRDQRYTVMIACSMETNTAGPQAGLIVDISLGGAGIETMGTVMEEFTLVFSHGGLALRLPCAPRHSRDLWGKRVIHTQFRSLSPDQQADLDGLLWKLAEDSEYPGTKSEALKRSLRKVLRR